MKATLKFSSLLILLAMSCTSENAGVQVGNPQISQLDYRAVSTETNDCRFTSVESQELGTDGQNQVGMNIYFASDLEVTEDPIDTFTTSIETADYFLTLVETGTIVTDIEFEAGVASPDVALSVLDFFIIGLENPVVDTDYELTITANSITCADGSTNDSEYKITFTLLHLDEAHSAE